jgi:membrane-associated phospholipid phosphatase/MFS family permease
VTGAATATDRGRLAGKRLLFAFSLAAVGAGAARGLTTSYLPVLLERIDDAPVLIGAVMSVNAIAGFAIPIGVGLWSDRRQSSGLGRRLPFMVGGTVLGAGGLVAVGLGSGSSYVALALAAAIVYVGLNALTTAHRALIADDVTDERRPAATSGQELATAIGAGLAVAIGGALIDPAPAAAFGLGAAVLVVAAVPTLLLVRRLGFGSAPTPKPATGARASLAGVLRRPGAREVLLAQTLWVFAYAALPAFFVLYAQHELNLGLGAAGVLPLAFGLFLAAGMVLGGRAKPDRVLPLLLQGATLLGVGLLVASATTNLAIVAASLVPAALGAGLVTSLGFPYFTRFVPAGEAGGYSGAYFAARGVASAAALPLAGVTAQLTGTYRSVFWLGATALVAVLPLLVAEWRLQQRSRTRALRPRPATVAAVMPVFASTRAPEVARAALRHVDELVLVQDGAPPEIARSLEPLAADDRVEIVPLAHNGGKGTAVAAGMRALLDRDSAPESILILDSDGQHDPERIPDFVEAARDADVVIGSRSDRAPMPAVRRLGNRLASLALLVASRAWVPDTQNGMRLFRTDALRSVSIPAGGYDAESRHLRALLADGLRVSSVEIPTIYDGEPSHFRPVGDTIAVARALVASPSSGERVRSDAGWRPVTNTLREWSPRALAMVGGTIAIGAALPALQPLDEAAFLAINHLGDGPGWLYGALDPHTRNYILLFGLAVVGTAVVTRRVRYAVGVGVAVVLAGYLAGVALEFAKVFVDRPRPEEILGAEAWTSHARDWSHIASYPSGHLIVTAALATVAGAAVPKLRSPLIVYVAAVAATRVLFGAHFPLDVVVGAALGYELGLLSVAMVASAGWLPAEMLRVPQPILSSALHRRRVSTIH